MATPTTHETTDPSDVNQTTRDVDLALTVREDAVGAATVREPDASAATVREGEASTGRGSRSPDAGTGAGSLLRLPEGLSSRYRIERELPTRGNEADLFVVRPLGDAADGLEVVVKLYRANVHPKDEVLTRIAALDGRHVIRQIEHAVSEGRSYEVIEYASEGSLADLMRETRFDDGMLKAMIREVTAGLGYLHSLDPPIVHRDVKPDNILVRSRDPLDLVLTDFGLSSVLEGGSWRASTLDRTIKYAAPEAGAGQVSREMDWWSLGMMVAEAASGRHPFAGVAEQTIGIHHSNRLPVPLDGIADERVKLLCQGLLCYDRKQRWGTDQVWRWIAGDTSLRPPVEETRQASAGAPFKFAGGSYGTIRELASAFAANWEAAQKTVARADGLLAWLKDEAKEYEAWQWLTEITQDKAQIDPGLKVTLLLPMLDPALPVMLDGEELTPERLLKEVTAAVEGNDSVRTARLKQLWEHLPTLAELSPGAAWLRDTHTNVEKARKEVSALMAALGPDAPKIAPTGTWDFVRHVLEHNADPNAQGTARDAFKALLQYLPEDAAPWIKPLRATFCTTVSSAWLVPQLEPHLAELLAEIERQLAKEKEIEAAATVAAEKAATQAALIAEKARAIRDLQDDLRDAEWTLTPQMGHEGAVMSVAFSPDGRHLITGSDDKTARLWDIASGLELRTFEGHKKAVVSVAFTPDGRHSITGNLDNTARLWDCYTGKEILTFSGKMIGVKQVAVTPDGNGLVVASFTNTAWLFDLKTGEELRSFSGHREEVRTIAFTPDGRQLVTGSGDNTVRIWDTSTGRELRAFDGHANITSVAVTPDGRHVVVGGYKEAKLLDLTTGQEIRAFKGHPRQIRSISITPDGLHLAVGGHDESFRLYEIATGREVWTVPGDNAVINCLAISPDGRLVVTGSADGTAQLLDLETGQRLKSFSRPPSGSTSVAVTPDGLKLATGYVDHNARLFEISGGTELCTFVGHTDSVTCMAVTPDGNHLLTGSADRSARLWDLASGEELRMFAWHADAIESLALTPDGHQMATASADTTAALWDLNAGKKLRTFVGHTKAIKSIAFTLNGRCLLTGGADKTARLWDVSTGRQLRIFAGHDDIVNSVAVAPDGLRLVTGSSDKTVRLWDIATGKEIESHTATSSVNSVLFTPDGRYVVIGCYNSFIAVWDTVSGMERGFTTGKLMSLTSVGISADGSRIFCASIDNNVAAIPFSELHLKVYFRPVSLRGPLTFGANLRLEQIDGDPNELVAFVRGMTALAVNDILEDPDETWREKTVAADTSNLRARTSTQSEHEPSDRTKQNPESSSTHSLVVVQKETAEKPRYQPKEMRPSVIPAFIRKLFL